jgi:hypothetical protein
VDVDVERGVALAVGGVTEVRDELVCDSFVSLLFAEGRTVIEVAWQAGHSPTMALATYGHMIEELVTSSSDAGP